MIIINMFLLMIWLGIAPVLLGMLYTRFSGGNKASLMLSYCSGMIIMLALCQLVTVPLIFLRKGMTSVLVLYGGMVAFLCLISVCINRKYLVTLIKKALKRVRSAPWTVLAAVALIVIQTAVLTTRCHIDDDDAFYVGTATAAVETGGLYAVDPYTGEAYTELPARYVLSPFPVFNAASSMITRVHPAAMAHTVFPAIFIPFVYMVYALLGSRLFGDDRWSSGCFLILTAVLYLFSGYSVYTEGMFLLVRIWQGKAFLAAALLPAVYYYGLRAFDQKSSRMDTVMLLALQLACAHVSSMGIMLGAIALGIAGIACALRYRKIGILCSGFLCCIPNLIYAALYLVMK